MIGKILGNYKILKQLGEGGMGTVYLAKDMTLERNVALKIISPELARKPQLMTRFRVEAIAQAKLNHSNITAIHSFDQQKDIYYIVMEFVDGKTLKEIIKEKGPLPLREALHIFAQILSGVAYAHGKGVIHRDIKPSNIFITGDRIVKIGDFGIAKVKGIEGLTKVGSSLGSPLYCSPEQVMGKPTDPRTDVYSLGITLYEMLTGGLPFKFSPDSDYQMMKQVIEMVPPTPSAINPSIPASLDAIIMKSITKTAEQRYPDVSTLEAEIKKIIATLPPESPQPGKAEPIRKKSPGLPDAAAVVKGNPKRTMVLVLVMAIVVVSLVIFLVYSSQETAVPHHPSRNGTGTSGSSTSASGGGHHTNNPPSTVNPGGGPGTDTGNGGIDTPVSNPGLTTGGETPPSTTTLPDDPPKSTDTPQPGSGETPSKIDTKQPVITPPITDLPQPTKKTVPISTDNDPDMNQVSNEITTICNKMDWFIKKEYYAKAVALGHRAIERGTISDQVYLKMGQAYFYDKKKNEAAEYYTKALELSNAITFKVSYEYRKNKFIRGTLSISSSTVSFRSDNQNINLVFSISLSQIKSIPLDRTQDVKGLFKKKRNRKNPMLIIKGKQKQRYTIQLSGSDDHKMRRFIRHIINTLREKAG